MTWLNDYAYEADDPQEGHEAEGLPHEQESDQGAHHCRRNGGKKTTKGLMAFLNCITRAR